MRGVSRSSLPLQVLLHFNGWFSLLYVILTLVLFIYKGTKLPYPPSSISLEIVFVVLFACIEYARIKLASKGNLTELMGPLLWGLLLSIICVFYFVYYLQWQTYVLRVDQVLNAIGLVFLFFEFVFGIVALIRFASAPEQL